MKIKFILLLLSALLVNIAFAQRQFIDSQTQQAATEQVADNVDSNLKANEKDNSVRFYKGTNVESVSVVYESANVSLGQSYIDELNHKKGKDYEEYTFKAGIDNTERVADIFKASTTDKGGAIAATTTGNGHTKSPGKLKFVINCTLIINGSPVLEPVFLAQGSWGASNNWWIGSPVGSNPVKDSIDELRVKTLNGKQYDIYNAFPDHYSSNRFRITKVD